MFKRIPSWLYGALSFAYLITIVRRVNEIVRKYVQNDEFVNRQLQKATQGAKTMKELLGFVKGNSPKPSLAERDTSRDVNFSLLLEDIDGYSRINSKPEMKEAAQLLQSIFTKHGRDLEKQAYDIQSAHINVIIDRCKQEDAQEALVKLDLVPAMETFIKSQRDFEATEMKETAINAQDVASTKRKLDARNIIVYRIDKLLNYLDSMIVDFPEQYTDLGKELTELIDQVNMKSRMRRSRGQALTPEVADEEEIAEAVDS